MSTAAFNSLDTIESCLDQIYRIRKKALAQRTKYNQQTLIRRHDYATQTFNNVRKFTTPSDNRQLEAKGMYDESLEEEEKAVKDIVSTFPTVAPAQKQTILTPDKLSVIKDNFEQDVQKKRTMFMNQDPANRDMETVVNELIDTYLSRNLDRVQQTTEVGNLKKFIALGIEELAIALEEADEASVIVEKSSTTDPKQPKSTQAKGQSPSHKASIAATAIKEHDALDKKAQEKLKVKQQYEQYMKTKQRVEKQSQEVSQRESLSVEIALVIDSIRSNPAPAQGPSKT
jgi:hypothetical protein